MAHINLKEGVPGIKSLALFRPETGKPLYALVEILLHGPSPLTKDERELVASYVSYQNNCMFCYQSHSAAARRLYGAADFIVSEVINDIDTAGISDKLKSLLRIADKVRISGSAVLPHDVEEAKNHGASDREIHDTVLIAATFCMFNRYVDGLNSFTPSDRDVYDEMSKRMVQGYVLQTH
ncbi:carboxymuconolactone decarboxylase family protein [Pollutibacter soli]|uniref:carboxymuconolactone decarboxylase family protein n=1 Tax=Pollutibacter soli TaxID=3034157 RepID=UPI003013751E